MAENNTLKFPQNSDFNTIVREGGTEMVAGNAIRLINELKPVYSRELEYQAEPNMAFRQFAAVKTELMTAPGNTIKMLTYNNLKLGEALTEGERIKTQAMTSAMKELVVKEHGTAVGITAAALQFSFVDEMNNALKLLGRNIAHTIETELRDVAIAGGTGTSKLFADGVAARANVAKALSTNDIKSALEVLATNNVPKVAGSYYVCFVSPHQARGIMDSEDFVNASVYAGKDELLRDEIGRVGDVRFIQTTLMPNGSAPVGDTLNGYSAELVGAGSGSANVYQALVMGEDYYAIAYALAPEIRTDTPADFQREIKVGWYGIYGCGVLNPTHGVVIESL